MSNTAADLQAASKFLSYILRHSPESIGITLDDGGWAEIDELVAGAAGQHQLSVDLIGEVVATNTKKRFSLSADGRRIRANQGHSISVDLGLQSLQPPDTLFHGTATRFLDAIVADGLRPGSRRHVHLSADTETALAVGRRHGKPTILTVNAGAMHAEGYPFYRSENGVWLTDAVPAPYLCVDS